MFVSEDGACSYASDEQRMKIMNKIFIMSNSEKGASFHASKEQPIKIMNQIYDIMSNSKK